MKKWTIVIILSFCFLGSVAKANEDTNREIVQTFVNFYIAQKQLDIAEEKVREHLAIDQKDSERWNLLGLILIEREKFSEADAAFKMAVETAEGETKGIFLYNHATAVHKLGRVAQAVALLKQVAEYPNLKSSAEVAIKATMKKDELPPLKILGPSDWSGNINIALGYDTNVALLAIGSMDAIVKSETSSPTGTGSLKLGRKSEYYSGSLDNNLSGSYTYYYNEVVKSFATISGTLTSKWQSDPKGGKFIWGVSNKPAILYLNTAGFVFYNWQDTAAWEATYTKSDKVKFTLEIPFRYQNYAPSTDTASDRTGIAAGFKISEQLKIKAAQLTFGLEFERVWTKGSTYRDYQYTVPVSWARAFPKNFIGVASFRGGQTYYTESTTQRRDSVLSPTIMINKILSSQFTLGLSYTYTRNLSSVPTAEYSKHAANFTVNYDAF